ncbi:MAG: SpoIVB peptidase S55 domain-containing protein [Minicystis sp.]
MRLTRTLRAFRSLPQQLAQLAEGRLVPLSLVAGVLASTALGAGIAHAVPANQPSDTLALEAVKPGMKGYGLTVFSGTKPEKFDVEIISTLHNFRPNQDLILIKTPHPRLEVTRTVAGMSGSPIYLDGKMIGAYAYGWLFGSEAIAGVTPIKSMIEELNRPIPRAIAPIGGSPIAAGEARGDKHAELPPGLRAPSPRAFVGAPEAYDLRGHGAQLAIRASAQLAAPEGSGLGRASTPILMGGMGNAGMRLAGDLLAPMGLEPLQAGGSASNRPAADAPTKYEDGGAIGVEMVRGDISAMGLGTVTRVSGDKLLAFGHPMLGGGIESLPTAIGRVHWILANQNRSFKIGEAARSLGALVNDRQAAIVVDTSVKALTFPMHVEITGVDGAPKTLWNAEVTHDQFMAPSFVAMVVGSAAETTTSERRDATWRAVSKVKVAKYGIVSVVDFGAGNAQTGGTPGPDDFARSRLVRAVGSLLNNPWEPVFIEGVETTMRVTFEREVSTLRSAKVLEPQIDAGQPVRIRLDLQPYQGKVESRIIEVKVPIEMAGREIDIDLVPGYDVERALPTPDSVAELVANLPNMTFDPESIVATFRLTTKENGASYKGKLASRLPPGALDTLRPSSQSDAPEVFSTLVHTAIPLGRFVLGRDTVHVEVHPVIR